MSEKPEPGLESEVKGLLFSQSFGVLSTLSRDVEGYPFGSVTPYSLDNQGRPVILISTIAQHTKNIVENNKVSLTVLANVPEGDPQAGGRLTYLADAERVSGKAAAEVSERHYRYFPNARGYDATHDFNFYRLQPKRVRYIGGFGKIYWVGKDQILEPNPFDGESESQIVTHMNQDHSDSVVSYCKVLKKIDSPEGAQMAGIDAHGFDVILAEKRLRFLFQDPIGTKEQAREKLVELAKMCRE